MNTSSSTALEKIKQALLFVPRFYKNPVQGIQNRPDLDWLEVTAIQVLVSVASGFLSGIISQNFLYLIWGTFFFPLISLFISMIAATGIHYGILFIFKEEFPLLRTYRLVVLANLPFLGIRTLYPILKSVDILGFIITAFLLTVGLIENYRLPKAKVIRYVTYLTAFFIITWLLQYAIEWKNAGFSLEMPKFESIDHFYNQDAQ